jgi:hypothetical protein
MQSASPLCVCVLRMSAQVEIVYTFTGKRIEKKTVTIEPDAADGRART